MGSTRLSLGLCIVMLLGAVAAVPAAVSAQEDQVTVTATIITQDGQSVGAGVDVTATWDGGSVDGTTASNGQVLLDVPRGENISIQIDDDRYVRNDPYVLADASSQSVDVPVAQSGTATITVRNSENETVENARVLLYRSNYVTDQRTGPDGTVTTPPVEQGDYGLAILKPGYYNNRTRLTVGSETTATRSIEQGEVSLTVSVVDDYFQTPQRLNASVRIPSVGTLQTQENGNVTVSVPVNTDYDITVTKDGYDQTEQTVEVDESDTSATIAVDRTDRLTVGARNQVLLGNPITLQVTDEYGDRVADATVSVDGEEVGTTDASGEYDIETESAGTVNVTVDDGDVEETVTVEVVEGREELDRTPSATPTATAQSTETSSGFGPGFTPAAVVAAIAALSLVAYRRR